MFLKLIIAFLIQNWKKSYCKKYDFTYYIEKLAKNKKIYLYTPQF